MSLQRRLTLYFVAPILLTLLMAGFLVQNVLSGDITRRAELPLKPSLEAFAQYYNAKAGAVSSRVTILAGSPRLATLVAQGQRAQLDRYLSTLVAQSSDLDFLIVTDVAGVPVASATLNNKKPDFLKSVPQPTSSEIVNSADQTGPGFHRTAPTPITPPGLITPVGYLQAGFWVDSGLLFPSSGSSPVRLSVVVRNGDKGRVIASTLDIQRAQLMTIPRTGTTFNTTLEGRSIAEAANLGGGTWLVASTPLAPLEQASRSLLTSLLALLVLAILGTSALAYLLARVITRPLEQLSEGANAIAEGRFDHRIPVEHEDEVGQVAAAFNEMSDRLSDTVGELYASRDQLHRAVRRVGETLRSTHDMKQMLESILNTAAEAVGADAATMWMFTPSREELYPVAQRGTPAGLTRIKVGEGIVGLVAERATNIMTDGGDNGPRPAHAEPAFPVSIAVPIYSQDRIMGVLSAYRNEPGFGFTQGDLETVEFLAEQGGAAIENVLLHEEAQRLSLTDQLTGAWNRRYFQMQFRQVLATAQRFERPFSILMLDLDHFKTVNDTYGHPRGDTILVDFAGRVEKVLREVDTFARYGGEEFICLLSETDLEGALTTAGKIQDAIKMKKFGGLGEEQVSLTVSIGVASHPEHGRAFRPLIEAADQALYRAKQEGRDRVCTAQKSPPDLKLAN
ncbi:MAG TPA: diguanylate cyclase [Actinomycetota bacterium]|jgi:diguanylate cyclase (GGDEF)-like protein|nr:diguanylate cyclase [Actinomycetota bacterium]